jgi:hypothetical protein
VVLSLAVADSPNLFFLVSDVDVHALPKFVPRSFGRTSGAAGWSFRFYPAGIIHSCKVWMLATLVVSSSNRHKQPLLFRAEQQFVEGMAQRLIDLSHRASLLAWFHSTTRPLASKPLMATLGVFSRVASGGDPLFAAQALRSDRRRLLALAYSADHASEAGAQGIHPLMEVVCTQPAVTGCWQFSRN